MRKRLATLAGALVLTIALPIAIDQGYFRYNPYPLPIIGLIAVLLYLVFFITSDIFLKWARSFYTSTRRLSFVTFVVAIVIIVTVLGSVEWFAISKSKEHISSLMAVKQPTHMKSQTKPSVPEEKQEFPDVTARPVCKKGFAIMMENVSKGRSVVRDPKYSIVVWDLDLPNRLDPLPAINTRTFNGT